MSRDREFIREFVVECREGLDRIDTELVALEATPGDAGRLNTILRTLHTIKGNSSFLDFTRLGELAHAGEALLAKLRDRQLEMTPGIADALLRMSSALRQLVAVIDSTGDEGMDEQALLVQELREWTAGSANAPGPVAATIDIPREEIGKPGVTPSKAAFSETSSLPPQPQAGSESPPVAKVGLPPVVATSPLESPPGAAPVTPPPARGGPASDPASVSMMTDSELATVIRVPIEQLDHLMNLVGELVLARNHIVQIVSGRQDDELTEPVQRLKVLMTSLQDGVMRTRMQPVRTAWRRYPRIVRDLGKQCGKQVELELQGGDTELDKSMLEAIADPLVHLVRNAVDHGIEKPYLRKIKGKPETGRLVVRAFQESGQVHIEISDDGAGLDLERVRQKAVAAGILTPERALVVSESELQESVFLPGFTTADRVTGLSGRGVGMDVVKTTVEQIGGTIELETRKDVGTTVRLTVPLTLAIIPAFLVFCGRQRFAVPQLNVVELLRLRGDEQRQACDHFHDAPVLRLRGELLPLADLCLRLGLESASDLAIARAAQHFGGQDRDSALRAAGR